MFQQVISSVLLKKSYLTLKLSLIDSLTLGVVDLDDEVTLEQLLQFRIYHFKQDRRVLHILVEVASFQNLYQA